MSKVSFYFGAPQRMPAVADLLSQPRPDNTRVVVFCPEQNMLDTLDRLLWTRQPLGFTPHCYADSPLAGDTPIVLSSTLAGAPETDTLLTLSESTPENCSRFTEIIEVVSLDETERASARERFRTYRAQGHLIESIDLGEHRRS